MQIIHTKDKSQMLVGFLSSVKGVKVTFLVLLPLLSHPSMTLNLLVIKPTIGFYQCQTLTRQSGLP